MSRGRIAAVVAVALGVLFGLLAPPAAAAEPDFVLELYPPGQQDTGGQWWLGSGDSYDYVSAYFYASTDATRKFTITATNLTLSNPAGSGYGSEGDTAESTCSTLSASQLSCTTTGTLYSEMSFAVVAGAVGPASLTATVTKAGVESTSPIAYHYDVRALPVPTVHAYQLAPGARAIHAHVTLGGAPLANAEVTASRVGQADDYGYTDGNGDADLEYLDVPDKGATYRVRVSGQQGISAPSAPVDVAVEPVTSGAALTITAAKTVGQDKSLRVSTRLTQSGAGAGYEELRLEQRVTGSGWKPLQQSRTDLDGSGWVDTQLRRSAQLRWVHPASFETAAATSPVAAVAVVPRATVIASPVIAPPGSRTTISISTNADSNGRKATLQERVRGTWRNISTRTLAGEGAASWRVKLAKVSKRTWRVALGPSGPLPAATSGSVKVRTTLEGKGPERDYAFLGGSRSHPVTWRTCKPITYRLYLKQAKAGAKSDVNEALRRISLYTKLKFRYLGTTKQVPNTTGRQPEMLRIGWAKPGRGKGRTPVLTGYEAGRGGSSWSGTHYFRGMVALDARSRLPAGFGQGATRGALLLHEIGHAVGLNHARTPSQIMYPILSNTEPASVFGAGDIAGLRKLGRTGRC
ncbi:MAG TPA: matrixin family metalloprotease [Candidatus Nanopelagicales bacterium]|nr:matrixin family metalloprotease [Candidatus Nanopelagicales bacterium]